MSVYVAIIPARAGSKELPGKNLRLIAGKPLIAWSIEQALSTEEIDRVIVSTDSEEIAEVARHYHAETPFTRPPELASDTATTESVLLHALDTFRNEIYEPDAIVLLQPTSPARAPHTISRAIAQFEDQNADSLVSVCLTHAFFWKNPPAPEALYNHLNRPRRQDIPLTDLKYRENGSVYITSTDILRQQKNRLGGHISLFEMTDAESHEIDNLADFIMIEPLLRHTRKEPILLHSKTTDAIVFDFDGVLTDNRVIVQPDGGEAVSCNRSDGLGLSLLKQRGMKLFILSSEASTVVTFRAQKLGIPSVNNVADKGAAFMQLCHENGLDPSKVVFVGNDINDLPAFKACGIAIAVADATPQICAAADHILTAAGGGLVAREIYDILYTSPTT